MSFIKLKNAVIPNYNDDIEDFLSVIMPNDGKLPSIYSVEIIRQWHFCKDSSPMLCFTVYLTGDLRESIREVCGDFRASLLLSDKFSFTSLAS